MEIHYGFGRHAYYLTEWQLIEFRKYAYGEWIQTFATLMWTKVSICLFLRRIPATKILIRPLEVAIGFLILSNIIITILWIVQCRPVDAAWNSNIEGSCFSKGQLERVIIAQASQSTDLYERSYFSSLLTRLNSHLCSIRFCLRCISHLDSLAYSNEVDYKN